ncbi:unnamed protein product [Soboliphyme baturini]|uniref:Uncharacterized protein n=1 Tax=Soboliphyme baturini TaxID=241478 RepID=A0A183IB04_9BILA|nr:unnamed protein product [Soboliphyme baturini]
MPPDGQAKMRGLRITCAEGMHQGDGEDGPTDRRPVPIIRDEGRRCRRTSTTQGKQVYILEIGLPNSAPASLITSTKKTYDQVDNVAAGWRKKTTGRGRDNFAFAFLPYCRKTPFEM